MEQYVIIILFGLLLFISCCISAANRRYDARLRLIEKKFDNIEHRLIQLEKDLGALRKYYLGTMAEVFKKTEEKS